MSARVSRAGESRAVEADPGVPRLQAADRVLRDERLWRIVAEENRGQTELQHSADDREGFAAFQEKRKPAFTGD